MDVASAYLGHGAGPRLASSECQKFVHSALQQYNIKFDKLANESGSKIAYVRQRLDDIAGAQAEIEVKFESIAADTLTNIKEQSRFAIEDAKEKTMCACKSFMEQATLLMKGHWQEEATRQKQEGLVAELSQAALELLNEDLSSMEARLAEAMVAATANAVEDSYKTKWEQELLTRVQRDVLGPVFKKDVSDEVASRIEEVHNRMRTVSQTMLERAREHSYSKLEVDTKLAANAEGADYMVQVVCRDVESLRRDMGQWAKSLEDAKTEQEVHIAEKLAGVDQKREEDKVYFQRQLAALDERVRVHVHTELGALRSRIDVMESEVSRANAFVADVETKMREVVQSESERMEAMILQEKEGRIDACRSLGTFVSANEQALATSEQVQAERLNAVRESVRDHVDQLQAALTIERERISEQMRALGDATLDIEKNADAVRSCEEAVQALTAHSRQAADDAISTAENALRTESERLTSSIEMCDDRVDALERSLCAQRGSEAEVSRAVNDIQEKLRFLQSVESDLAGIRNAQQEEREERTKEFSDLRRDLDFVVRPLLGDTSSEGEEGALLVTSLARTCLDWQNEMKQLREKVKELAGAQQGIDTTVKNRFTLHEEQLGQAMKERSAGMEQCLEDVRQAAQEAISWVHGCRSKDEVQIEEQFLGVTEGESCTLSEAIREMLAELHRHMSSAERLLACQIGYVQGDVDKIRRVISTMKPNASEAIEPS